MKTIFSLIPIMFFSLIAAVTSAQMSDLGAPFTVETDSLTDPSSTRITNPIRLHAVAYGYTYSRNDLRFMADHFSMIVGLYDRFIKNPYYVDVVKGYNANTPVIYYSTPLLVSEDAHGSPNPRWSQINAHEDWFMHDANGNRIRYLNDDWLMDPRSEGWRSCYLEEVGAVLGTTLLDGTFGDLVFHDIAALGNDLSAQPPRERQLSWYNDVRTFLEGVHDSLGDALFIVNTFDMNSYDTATDGIMLERFCHAWWSSVGDPYEYADDWKQQIDALARISASGKWFLAQSGITYRNGPPYTDLKRILRYCLGSYLLGKSGDRATFYFIVDDWTDTKYTYDDIAYYTPEYTESHLGAPLSAYVSNYRNMGGVYAREFENGLVVVNPSRYSRTMMLDIPMTTLDQGIVESLTLAGHSAEILMNLGPILVKAASRKIHGSKGAFDIDLPLADSQAIECRLGGPTQMILTFSKPIAAMAGNPDETSVSCANVLLSSGVCDSVEVVDTQMVLNMSGAAGYSCLTITLAGLADTSGNPLQGKNSVSLRVIEGEINGVAPVDLLDLSMIKNQLSKPVTSSNYMCDVNADNAINTLDLGLVKRNLFKSASCP